MMLIIDNIRTPYEIDRYNRIHKELHGDLEVWFHTKAEPNRNWKRFPEMRFVCRVSRGGLLNPDLREFLKKNKHRISRIICCGWNAPIYWYSLYFAKRNGLRFTLWSGSTAYEQSILRTLSKPFTRYFVSKCDDFIAYGSRAKQYLQVLGASPARITVYYNSVDVDFFRLESAKLGQNREELRKKHSIPIGNTVILFVGQLIPRKAVIELTRAFVRLPKSKRVTLLMVGSGPLKEHIHDLMRENPRRSIIHRDHVEYANMPQIFAISDVLILPSKEEVWGLVVNEAMASGLPVLVSKRAGCMPDLVKDTVNGYTFMPNESDILAVLSRFLSLPAATRSRMGIQACKTIQAVQARNHFVNI